MRSDLSPFATLAKELLYFWNCGVEFGRKVVALCVVIALPEKLAWEGVVGVFEPQNFQGKKLALPQARKWEAAIVNAALGACGGA